MPQARPALKFPRPFPDVPALKNRHPQQLTALICIFALLACGLVHSQESLLPGLPTAANSPPASATTDPLNARSIEGRLAAVTTEIDIAGATRNSAQLAVLSTIQDTLQDEREVARLLAKGSSAAENDKDSPAPSLLLLGNLYLERDRLMAHKDELAGVLASNREALADAENSLTEAQRTLASQSGEATMHNLAVRLAQETVHLRALEVRAAEQSGGTATLRALDARIDKLQQSVVAGSNELDLTPLAEREGTLKRQHEAIERELSTTNLRLAAIEKRYSDNPSPLILDQVRLLTRTRDVIKQRINITTTATERIDEERTAWQRWHMLLTQRVDDASLITWQEQAQASIAGFDRDLVLMQGRITDARSRLAGLEKQIGSPADPSLSPALGDLQKQLTALVQLQLRDADNITMVRSLFVRISEQIEARNSQFSPIYWLKQGVAWVLSVWNFEVTVVDTKPITIGSIFIALLLAGIGMSLSRRLSGRIGRLAIERFKLEQGAAAAIQTMTFYALLVGFTLLALKAVNFPLTAFTVLGGALAIGVGFGSQNVMNNFISGLILMLERPVRVQDVIEVDSNHGTIEKIGARSTQIRSTDGRHMVVPNSFFLESNVVNWTLSDDLLRAKVSVGVAYGSPTRLVEQRIRECVVNNEAVLPDPEPIIIFEEFGDNSLNFDAYFWIHARSPMHMRKVQSQVRFDIDEAFAKDDIVIAFPQRDVHLDTSSPLEIRVQNTGKVA